ncbi:MAG: ATP synthase F1 subunit gamma [Bacteroidales bacterium]|nr:ATP synthase F1 subunit gamma [Bacteroidales bacterium]
MANLKEVRTRIASVSSTQQITSAMKMVSAAKFRRAQVAIIGMRPYANQLNDIVSDIDTGDGVQTPYHEVRKLEHVLLVVVTSNKGLCGAFNSNVIKQAQARIDYYKDNATQTQPAELSMITIGKRGSEFFAKRFDNIVGSYDELLDGITFDSTAILADQLMQQFCEKKYDRIELIYNQFKNSLVQILSTEQFLPIVPRPTSKAKVDAGAGSMANDYIYEPSKEDILREMIPLMLRSHFYRVLLDSLAAEHGARMNAMQKATDNATELLKELRLSYNKARQAAITNEIIEIVSGSEALKG